MARNRSEGWAHAKSSGHINEVDFAEDIRRDRALLHFLEAHKFGSVMGGEPTVKVDGAKSIECLLGGSTISKSDIEVDWGSGRSIGVPVKKSESGQVWLVSLDRFASALRLLTGDSVPNDVMMGLALFIGGGNLSAFQDDYQRALRADIVRWPTIAQQESHQNRLVAKSISTNFSGVWDATLAYLSEHISLLTELCFARGLAGDPNDYADYVIYNNAPSGNNVFSTLFLAEASKAEISRSPITAGPRNGGSTISLPTGFLQMHHPRGENLLQFHHQYAKVSALRL